MRKLFAIFLLCGLILFFGALVFAGPIGGGGSGATSVTGTANQVIANPTTGAVILSTPQNIHMGATPTFGGLTLTPGPITITGGTVTTSAPLLDLTQTWNAAGVTFTGLKANITDTASAAGSLLMDLQVGGVSKFKIKKDGALISGLAYAVNNPALGDGNGGLSFSGGGSYFSSEGSSAAVIRNGLVVSSYYPLGFSPGAADNAGCDTCLHRDAANTLAQRNGTNAQTMRVYGTFTDTANYERMALSTQVGTGVTIAAERAGTGAANLGITLAPAGTGNVIVASGNVGIGTTVPGYPLHIRSLTNTSVEIENQGSSLTGFLGLHTSGALQLQVNRNGDGVISDATKSSAGINIAYGVSDSYISFATGNTNGVSGVERLRIDKNGNVGIGDLSPVSLLTVGDGDAFQVSTTGAVTVGASGTAITQMRVYTPTLDPALVAAAATAEQTYTVTGLTTADKIVVNKPTYTAGCVIGNARVSAADTLAITWGNVQAVSACDPPSEVYNLIAIRS